jgi:hypothetical protein
MKHKVCAVLFAASFIYWPTYASPDDSFLDQPIPPHFTGYQRYDTIPNPVPGKDEPLTYFAYGSFRHRMQVIDKFTPRRVVWPIGLADFVNEIDSEPEKYHDLFLHEGTELATEAKVYREYLNLSLQGMGLDYHYDAKAEALVVDFVWHRDDPRPLRELLKVLSSPHPTLNDYPNPDDDPRWPAFDGLLSKPENFSKAWKLRFMDRSCGIIENLFWAGNLPDEKGTPHFVVINCHVQHNLPGMPGVFGCYVFDTVGHFEQGSLFEFGGIEQPRFKFDPAGKRLVVSYNDYRDAKGGKWFDCGYLTLKQDGIKYSWMHPETSTPPKPPLFRTPVAAK